MQRVSQGQYALSAENEQDREALIAWGRIPGVHNREEALNAYINIPRAEYHDIAQAALSHDRQEQGHQHWNRVSPYGCR